MTPAEAIELAYNLEPLVREEWERRFLENIAAREEAGLKIGFHLKRTLQGMAEKYKKGLDRHSGNG